MQIVIDIPEDVIECAKSSPNYYPTYHFKEIWRAIVNGIPLPKGHGDLIDRRELKKEVYTTTEWNGDVHRIIYEASIDDAKPIIEADRTIVKADREEQE